MPVTPSTSVSTPGLTNTPAAGGAAQATEGAANSFASALDGVAGALNEADALAQQAATGQLQDLSQLTAAMAKADLGLQLTVAFRDRALNSFQQIMQMQI
jgi:flagellar hook-basal body complex protein FliE